MVLIVFGWFSVVCSVVLHGIFYENVFNVWPTKQLDVLLLAMKQLF